MAQLLKSSFLFAVLLVWCTASPVPNPDVHDQHQHPVAVADVPLKSQVIVQPVHPVPPVAVRPVLVPVRQPVAVALPIRQPVQQVAVTLPLKQPIRPVVVPVRQPVQPVAVAVPIRQPVRPVVVTAPIRQPIQVIQQVPARQQVPVILAPAKYG